MTDKKALEFFKKSIEDDMKHRHAIDEPYCGEYIFEGEIEFILEAIKKASVTKNQTNE